MSLSAELSKPEHQGKPLRDLFLELSARTVPQVGKIEGEDLRDVVSILASGLQDRLDKAADHPVRTALRVGFEKMSIKDFGFNLADPKVSGMLDQGVALELVTEDERSEFYRIATKQVPEFPGLTLRDLVALVHPDQTDVGPWKEVEVGSSRVLALTLEVALPEPSLVRVEMSESLDGITWTAWRRVSHFYDVESPGLYLADIPGQRPGVQRRLRCRGEFYKVVGSYRGA